MKRGILILLLAMCVSSLHAQEAPVTRSNALLFHPLALAAGAVMGAIEVIVEYQHAFGDYFVASLKPDIAFTSYGTVFGGYLGAIVHPVGGGLKGFYIAAYGGAVFVSSYLIPAASLQLGYQWVLKGGFVTGVGGGAKYDSITGVTAALVLPVGFAL